MHSLKEGDVGTDEPGWRFTSYTAKARALSFRRVDKSSGEGFIFEELELLWLTRQSFFSFSTSKKRTKSPSLQFRVRGRLKMKVRIGMMIVGLFAFSVAIVHAQDDATKTTHKKVRTLSGCLQKTDDANEYKLTTAKGGTWEIKSDAVKLGEHIGHTVQVTGVVSNAAMHGAKEDAKAEAKEHGIGKNSTEHGHMTVTSVKMVSESCTQ